MTSRGRSSQHLWLRRHAWAMQLRVLGRVGRCWLASGTNCRRRGPLSRQGLSLSTQVSRQASSAWRTGPLWPLLTHVRRVQLHRPLVQRPARCCLASDQRGGLGQGDGAVCADEDCACPPAALVRCPRCHRFRWISRARPQCPAGEAWGCSWRLAPRGEGTDGPISECLQGGQAGKRHREKERDRGGGVCGDA